MPSANLFQAQFEYDPADPDGYRSGVAYVGKSAGGQENIVKLFELPAGQSVCPYHYEYAEEWLLVLAGPVQLRGRDGVQTLDPGALICFPRGPAGAHKVTNQHEQPARLMMFSSSREPAVAVYPDSGKIGVWPGNPEDELMLKRSNGQVHYFEGESS